MSNVLKTLMKSVEEAREKLESAEQTRDLFLDPILAVLGATGGSISRCSIDAGELHVTRSGSCRGYGWDDSYEFPLAIFTCEDPLKAAGEYVTAKRAAKEDQERRSKVATIERLQNELATGGAK